MPTAHVHQIEWATSSTYSYLYRERWIGVDPSTVLHQSISFWVPVSPVTLRHRCLSYSVNTLSFIFWVRSTQRETTTTVLWLYEVRTVQQPALPPLHEKERESIAAMVCTTVSLRSTVTCCVVCFFIYWSIITIEKMQLLGLSFVSWCLMRVRQQARSGSYLLSGSGPYIGVLLAYNKSIPELDQDHTSSLHSHGPTI